MPEFGMHEAKTTLSKLVERAQHGEEIVITRNGMPVVRLEPIRKKSRFAETRGMLKGEDVWIADDFNDLPDDIADAFGVK